MIISSWYKLRNQVIGKQRKSIKWFRQIDQMVRKCSSNTESIQLLNNNFLLSRFSISKTVPSFLVSITISLNWTFILSHLSTISTLELTYVLSSVKFLNYGLWGFIKRTPYHSLYGRKTCFAQTNLMGTIFMKNLPKLLGR